MAALKISLDAINKELMTKFQQNQRKQLKNVEMTKSMGHNIVRDYSQSSVEVYRPESFTHEKLRIKEIQDKNKKNVVKRMFKVVKRDKERKSLVDLLPPF